MAITEYISCANTDQLPSVLKLLIKTGDGTEDYIDCDNQDDSWFSLIKRMLVTDGTDVFLSVVLRHSIHTDDVSNPPTDAELDTIFGTPATVGEGFEAIINDNGAGNNLYRVLSDGTAWWWSEYTKAV